MNGWIEWLIGCWIICLIGGLHTILVAGGLRIAPDQWSSLLYGDSAHKSHMQSIIDKLQTPQSFGQSVQVSLLTFINDTWNYIMLKNVESQFKSGVYKILSTPPLGVRKSDLRRGKGKRKEKENEMGKWIGREGGWEGNRNTWIREGKMKKILCEESRGKVENWWKENKKLKLYTPLLQTEIILKQSIFLVK